MYGFIFAYQLTRLLSLCITTNIHITMEVNMTYEFNCSWNKYKMGMSRVTTYKYYLREHYYRMLNAAGNNIRLKTQCNVTISYNHTINYIHVFTQTDEHWVRKTPCSFKHTHAHNFQSINLIHTYTHTHTSLTRDTKPHFGQNSFLNTNLVSKLTDMVCIQGIFFKKQLVSDRTSISYTHARTHTHTRAHTISSR